DRLSRPERRKKPIRIFAVRFRLQVVRHAPHRLVPNAPCEIGRSRGKSFLEARPLDASAFRIDDPRHELRLTIDQRISTSIRGEVAEDEKTSLGPVKYVEKQLGDIVVQQNAGRQERNATDVAGRENDQIDLVAPPIHEDDLVAAELPDVGTRLDV